ncbi:hypothetical protein CANMA_003595 [Candida margitis]|uniref:uncharacterized protein n=1 Tax=Candida margitis TaxID=1775924 RepID=UPI002227C2F4|nr:uncharacterized protein CANMA_003595 [Candida margitis]KAI5963429.1 hypothetical protein CANMA_003595 [Candida margitis]
MKSYPYFKKSSFDAYIKSDNSMSKFSSGTLGDNFNEKQNEHFYKNNIPRKKGDVFRLTKQEYTSESSEDGDSSASSQHDQQPQQDLIDCLNNHIFAETESEGGGSCYFPISLKIYVSSARAQNKVEHMVSQFSKLSINEEEFDQSQPQLNSSSERVSFKTLSIGFKSKTHLEDLIYRLHDEGVKFELDYSKFVSHPGVLFIKNLSSDLVCDDNKFTSETSSELASSERLKKHRKLCQYLNDNCHFKSLQDIRLFNNESTSNNGSNGSNGLPLHSSSNSSVFAIVKFANYLDVDMLIDRLSKQTPNAFHDNPDIPLFLNKYINKRERSSLPPGAGISNNFASRRSSSASSGTTSVSTSSSSTSLTRFHPSLNISRNTNDNFSLIILENLINFLPHDLTKDKFERFLHKIKMFGNNIESIYFPIVDKGDASPNLHLFDFGYIRFKSTSNFMENTFRVLYYLNELLWDEVMALDMKNLPSLMEEDYDDDSSSLDRDSSGDNVNERKSTGNANGNANGNESKPVVMNRKLSVTVAQHKHNHYLFSQTNQYYLSFNPSLLSSKQSPVVISYPNPIYTINAFIRNVNYQETNLYVNNFSSVFNNDDVTWESFWKQFGSIKSAKIIKPHFYQDEDSIDGEEQKAGRIGFIFYETFKMAIRAILMTNNKLVHVDNFNPMVIQSSFAIQKPNSSQKSFPLPPAPPVANSSLGLSPDFSLPSPKTPAFVHASSGGGMQYYTYQPFMPYYYGYHPNPYILGAQGMFNAGAAPNIERPGKQVANATHTGNGPFVGQGSVMTQPLPSYKKS